MSSTFQIRKPRQHEFIDATLEALNATRQEPELPDIVTFCEHPSFLAGGRLYPKQKTLLRLVYLDTDHMTAYDLDTIEQWRESWDHPERVGVPPDIWERVEWLKRNGYRRFREFEFIGGRRGSKNVLGAKMVAYEAWRLLKLQDPQYFYGIERSKDLYCLSTATTQQQAIKYQFSDIAITFEHAPCFRPHISQLKNYYLSLRTPFDERRIAEYQKQGVRIDREVATIRFLAMSSNSRAGRGAAAFALIFDEFAHHVATETGPATAGEIYKAQTPSLGQMGKDGFIYIPTSPWAKSGHAYTIYADATRQDEETQEPENPDMLVVQLRSWDIYEDYDDPEVTEGRPFREAPEKYDDQMRREEKRDPEAFRVERRAQWAEVIDAYLNPKVVDWMFEPIQMPDGSTRVLEPVHAGILYHVYRGHGDPAVSGSNFAFIIAHAEDGFPDEDGEEWAHVIVDHIKLWKPTDYDDGQIPYTQVEKEIAETILRFHNLKVFSYDQYGGFVTVPRMKTLLKRNGHHARVIEKTFTEVSKSEMYERLKSALGMRWVHSFRDDFGADSDLESESLLDQELKFLQGVRGRAGRILVRPQPTGPVTTDDLADCLCVCVSELLKDQIDRWERNQRLGGQHIRVTAQGGYVRKRPLDQKSLARGAARDVLGRHKARAARRRRFPGG